MTGAELVTAIERAAREAGVDPRRFAKPLSADSTSWLEQLRATKRPTPQTIARIRALLDGCPVPPGRPPIAGVVMITRAERERRGIPPSQRMTSECRPAAMSGAERARIARARDLSEIAHETRRPGQTLHDRVRELRSELVE